MNGIVYLAGWRSYDKVCVNIFLTELFGNVKTQRTVIVVDVSFRDIT